MTMTDDHVWDWIAARCDMREDLSDTLISLFTSWEWWVLEQRLTPRPPGKAWLGRELDSIGFCRSTTSDYGSTLVTFTGLKVRKVTAEPQK